MWLWSQFRFVVFTLQFCLRPFSKVPTHDFPTGTLGNDINKDNAAGNALIFRSALGNKVFYGLRCYLGPRANNICPGMFGPFTAKARMLGLQHTKRKIRLTPGYQLQQRR